MARATYGSILTINCNDKDFPPEWGKHEWVRSRTIKRQGDAEWINRYSTSSVLDSEAKDGVRVDLNGDAAVCATVARMVIGWGLTRDRLDEVGNPIVREDGSHVQEPITLPDESEAGLEQRLEILRGMHALDVLYMFNRITGNAPVSPLTTPAQLGNSAPSASVPSSES